jgi:hypothetical protein
MSQIITNRCKPAAAAVVPLLLASLLVAACGSSSSGSSGGSTSTATASANAGAADPAKRFAVRECLAKQGIKLPQRPAGQRPAPGAGGFFLGGRRLPAGVTRAQYEAAVKKCGGFARRGFGDGARLASPAVKEALAKFAACMRENGENVPAPNTSGSGPIFKTNGLNTTSAQFRAAQAKCMVLLRGAFVAPEAGPPPAG